MVIYHNINPTIFDFGDIEIRWYGLFYVIGFIIAYFFLSYLVKLKRMKLGKEQIVDFLGYAAIGVIVGGRLGYVLFYDISYYLDNPLKIFAVWEGGMSFHGGLIGVMISGFVFCKKNRVEFYELADISVVPITLGLALGRIGNFINGELYGRPTSIGLCIDYSKNTYIANPPRGCRWPSQLLESAKNLLIFSTLWFIKDKNLPKGFLFYTFIAMYGGLRFAIEFVRQPDPQIGLIFGFTEGQLLCLPMFLFGTFMLFRLKRKNI
ncbi:MAG: prolipoprotein diacylglyceryl transferase [Candidatus Woesearchaeota archaeon]